MSDQSDHAIPWMARLDLEFVESKIDVVIRSMAPSLKRLVPFSFWFRARSSARIVVARLQFYPTMMERSPRLGETNEVAIPLFVASTDRLWEPFDDDDWLADNLFDRAAGMKDPPVEARSDEEEFAYEMARIGVGWLETEGTILPPCQVPRSIAGRDDIFLIGAATSWTALPHQRIITKARYPLLMFRGRAQWAACVVPFWFWNPTAFAFRPHSTSEIEKCPLTLAQAFADKLPDKLLWPPYEMPAGNHLKPFGYSP